MTKRIDIIGQNGNTGEHYEVSEEDQERMDKYYKTSKILKSSFPNVIKNREEPDDYSV